VGSAETKEGTMLAEMCVGDDAPVVLWTSLAQAAPSRGLAASNRSGVYQLYAWDVDGGDLRQLTDRPEGQLSGVLSPDGRHVYYMQDRQGNEIGHYVRLPFEGGEPQDVTPDMPDYSSLSLAVSHAGNLLGFTTAGADGFTSYCVDLGPDGAPGARRSIYRSPKLAFGPTLSYGGEIAVMASTERTGMQHYELLAFDTAGGEPIGALWDGAENSLSAVVQTELSIEHSERMLRFAYRILG
jgi:hypothetical protein